MLKKGFTLAEILITLFLIAVIVAIVLKNIKLSSYEEKSTITKALKAMDAIEQASYHIRDFEQNSCPTRSFMENIAGKYTYTLMNNKGNKPANASDIVALYGKYIRYQNTSLNFCEYSGYCNNNTAIKGAKLVGGTYIGFENKANIFNCPKYYLPNDSTKLNTPTMLNLKNGNMEASKCWGNVYIDVNGEKAPNTLGKDVFVFGLNGMGIAK